ncbi:hypothetical protein NMY22_g15166 [Coprinellus aureogranulatus]|nr:hypothetical protein NMY22_g15166 [Coprinellus aureogranulatus]
MDRGRSSPFEEQIAGDAVRPTESRLSAIFGEADHELGNSDHGGGVFAHSSHDARAMMWGGLVESPTESEVWILFVYQNFGDL